MVVLRLFANSIVGRVAFSWMGPKLAEGGESSAALLAFFAFVVRAAKARFFGPDSP